MSGVLPATNEYLLTLLRSCLNGTQPPEKPETVSWEEVYLLAKDNSVICLAYKAICELQSQPQGAEREVWKTGWNKRMVAFVNQTTQAERLIGALKNRGLRSMPIKGYWLRQMYPEPELREMADLDLLVDDSNSADTKQMMQQLGYTYTNSNDYHSAYRIEPYIDMELHNELMSKDSPYRRFFSDFWSKSVTADDSGLLRRMKWEDFYTHYIAHFANHYFSYGNGIRSIADIYVIHRKLGSQLDLKYIEEQLRMFGLEEFEQTAVALSKTWFLDGTYDEKQIDMANKLFVCGVYGNRKMFDANQIAKLTPKGKTEHAGRRVYFRRMLFPPYAEMEELFPVLRKARFLLPFFWIYRGLRSVFRLNRVRYYYRRAMKK